MENHSSSETRDVLVKDVNELKKNVVQVAQDVRQHASAHVDETKQRVKETVKNFQDSLGPHPVMLLGLGFALGFLFGLRFSR